MCVNPVGLSGRLEITAYAVYTVIMDKSRTASGKDNSAEELYLKWSSPSRIFKARNKEFFTNIGAIVFLLLVILVFAREFALIAAVLGIVFFIYVTSTVPPENVEHRLTSMGIESAGHFYRWEEFAEFWFEEQWGQNFILLQPAFGTRILILLGSQDKEKVRSYIARHVPFRENPQKTWLDNASRWLSEKVPLEKPQS